MLELLCQQSTCCLRFPLLCIMFPSLWGRTQPHLLQLLWLFLLSCLWPAQPQHNSHSKFLINIYIYKFIFIIFIFISSFLVNSPVCGWSVICQSGGERPRLNFRRFQGLSCGQHATGPEVARAGPNRFYSHRFPPFNLQFTYAGSFSPAHVGLMLLGVHSC